MPHSMLVEKCMNFRMKNSSVLEFAIVFPLFSVLTEYFPQLSFTLDNIKKNSEYFKKIEEDENKKK